MRFIFRTNLVKEKCGENYQRCQSIFTFALSRYLLIITSAFLISVFIVRCFFLCLNCRTNSTNDHYQSVEMINEEESSPPSYEQVMNENNHYRLENF